MHRSTGHPTITERLLSWYESHGRKLPWRETRDPYRIWISEIILQQTRIAQGGDYYLRFIARFPTIQSLAEADEEEVLKLWQGLGYYSRARNLHAAARQIMDHFKGSFPTDHANIRSLRGVGDYTAAAISSIVFHEPYAVVDGNVQRVIARLFAIETSLQRSVGKKRVAAIAQSLIARDDPGAYNQAIMDFGALVCTPRQPRCSECVLQELCTAYGGGRVDQFPVNDRKIAIRKRHLHYLHICHNDATFLQKRQQPDIWKNLYEFPLIETQHETDLSRLQQRAEFKALFDQTAAFTIDHSRSMKHQLTHQLIIAHFYRITLPDHDSFPTPAGCIRINHAHLTRYPVSRLTDKYMATI